jgi:sugar phosphate isomerase/epimerase
MKVGAMNNPRNRLLDEVRLIGESGFDYVDLTVEYPEATPQKIRADMPKLRDALSTRGLGLVGHMPWFLNIIHPYEGVRKATLAECGRIFDVCAELGIGHVTIHPDFQRFRRQQREVVALTVESLGELAAEAGSRGLTLCLENFEEDYFSVENLREIFASVEGLKFTLDVGHAYMKAKKTDNVVRMIGELKGSLRHVHMHDNHGFRDEHLPLGVGSIEFPKIVAALQDAGYDGTITLEIHADDREYLEISKRKLMDMWG